ncbi:hypothetical protein AAFF_G00424060 [Aldrovandia affinis]|uniref:ZP-C domain-containing protein n=1 Tax=Aldrovandia affinis TaxID=143900 RepID=A0AAD7T6S4_9TELE|nr:hypothetical protein AAFF_G00424060 [Aldrovandia affinis]
MMAKPLLPQDQTGSPAAFLLREQDDKLHFYLDAFRFSQETRSSIYIFCHLKAAAASAVTDAQYKACTRQRLVYRWEVLEYLVCNQSLFQVGGCCDAGCSLRNQGGWKFGTWSSV